VTHTIKEYEESESNTDEIQMLNRKKNRILRYSSKGKMDWTSKNSIKLRNHSFLEDLIVHNKGFGPSPKKVEENKNDRPRLGSLRKSSLVGKTMNNRFTESNRLVTLKPVRQHRRRISLFDNENIMSMGLGGQPSSNIFQVRPNTLLTKRERRTKTIHY
jgi:hypothetical protein